MELRSKKYAAILMALGFILLIVLSKNVPLTHAKIGPRGALIDVEGDYWPTEEWIFSTPEEQGMDSSVLNGILEDIYNLDMAVHSVIVVRNGYIVMENYTAYYTPTILHTIQSCTKSVISALIGIAIDKGYIDNVSQRVIDFFPNITIENMDLRK
jgi:hypothetical protein